MSRRIILSKTDVARLRKILSEEARSAIRDLDHLAALGEEIDLAHIVEGAALPHDAVTLNAIVRVVDIETNARQEYTLVSPTQADMAARRLSVTAPLGVALLGYRCGDEVTWEMPGGIRRLRIDSVLQPSDQVVNIRPLPPAA